MKHAIKSAFSGILGVVALAALLALPAFITGCSVKKIEYEKKSYGEISYRIYENDHWLKTESTGLTGGMTEDGRFQFAAEGLKSSPSEEFNRTMQTYTTAFVQLAQIAAAAYNPSASAATSAAKSATGATSVVVNAQGASATNCTDCVDCAAPAAK